MEEADAAGRGLWQTAACVSQLLLARRGSVPGGVWEGSARSLASTFLGSLARHLSEKRGHYCCRPVCGWNKELGILGLRLPKRRWLMYSRQSGRSQASFPSPSEQSLSKLLSPSHLKHWLLELHTLGFPPFSPATPLRFPPGICLLFQIHQRQSTQGSSPPAPEGVSASLRLWTESLHTDTSQTSISRPVP